MKQTPSFLPGIVLLSATLFAGTVVLFWEISRNSAETGPSQNLQSSLISPIQNSIQNQQELSSAEILLQEGRVQEAATLYSEQLKSNPNDLEAGLELAKLQLKMGALQESLKLTESLLEKTPNNEALQLLHVRALAANERFEDAQNQLNAQNDSFAKNVLQTLFLFSASQAETAESSMNSLLKKEAHPQLLQMRTALEAFKKQEDGQPVYRDALISKALLEAGEPWLAARLAKNVLNQQSDYRDVWIILGYAQLEQALYPSAKDSLRTATQLDPLNAQAHYLLGLATFKQNQAGEAVRSFELAILHGYQDLMQAYLKLGEAQSLNGQFEDAVETYETLILLGNAPVDWYVNPVWMSLEKPQGPLRARSLAEQAVEAYPESAGAHSLLAWVLLRQNQVSEATQAVNTAFRLDRKIPDPYLIAGMIEENRGASEKARKHYQEAFDRSSPETVLSKLAADRYAEVNKKMIQE